MCQPLSSLLVTVAAGHSQVLHALLSELATVAPIIPSRRKANGKARGRGAPAHGRFDWCTRQHRGSPPHAPPRPLRPQPLPLYPCARRIRPENLPTPRLDIPYDPAPAGRRLSSSRASTCPRHAPTPAAASVGRHAPAPGGALPGAPVRSIHNMPLRRRRWSTAGRPVFGLGGSSD